MEPLTLLEFGPFRIDLDQRLLFRGAEVIPIAPKAFETLRVLVENRGRVVGKDDLLKRVWPEDRLHRSERLVEPLGPAH